MLTGVQLLVLACLLMALGQREAVGDDRGSAVDGRGTNSSRQVSQARQPGRALSTNEPSDSGTLVVVGFDPAMAAGRVLDSLASAIEGYRAEYGAYPPEFRNPAGGYDVTRSVEYEHEYAQYQGAWFRSVFMPGHNDPGNVNTFFADMCRTSPPLPVMPGWCLGYRYGLCSHLYPRSVPGCNDYVVGTKGCWYEQDTARDATAKAGWQGALEGVRPTTNLGPHPTPPALAAQSPYTNRVVTILDPWQRNYRYECRPPYSAYRLWSAGADGTDGSPDDVGRGSSP
jgi:hypothetical protein